MDTLPENSSEKKDMNKKGCLFGLGCVGAGLLGCFGLIVILVVVFFGFIAWFQNNFISAEPLAFPPVYLTEKEEAALDARLKEFNKAIKENPDKEFEMRLTSKEINFILQRDAEKSGTQVYIEPKSDDTLDFMISSQITEKGVKSEKRYMNLSGNSYIDISGDRIKIKLNKFKVGKLQIGSKDWLVYASKQMETEFSQSRQFGPKDYKVASMKVEKGDFVIKAKFNPVAEKESKAKEKGNKGEEDKNGEPKDEPGTDDV